MESREIESRFPACKAGVIAVIRTPHKIYKTPNILHALYLAELIRKLDNVFSNVGIEPTTSGLAYLKIFTKFNLLYVSFFIFYIYYIIIFYIFQKKIYIGDASGDRTRDLVRDRHAF